MIDITTEFEAVGRSYAAIESILQWPDSLLFEGEESVSDWSAAQQLHHLAKVNTVIAQSLIQLAGNSEEVDSDRRTSIPGVSVLATGYIPRGRGQSPARLRPSKDITRDDLQTVVLESIEVLERVDVLLALLRSRSARIQHPDFGFMKASQWIRFMNVHTNHHLKIIRDIERSRRN